jgi:hypothetical protein
MEKQNDANVTSKRVPLTRGTLTRPIIELELEYEDESQKAEKASGPPKVTPTAADSSGGPVTKP